MQVSAAQASRPSAKSRLSSANWKSAGQFASTLLKKTQEGHGETNSTSSNNYANNTSSNSYANTTSNTNVNNNTYVAGGYPATAPSTTYIVPVDTGTAAPVYSGDGGTVPVYTAESGTVPVYGGDCGTLPVYTADGGTVPAYTVPGVDSGIYEAAGDTSVYNTAVDVGSSTSADDSGVADAVAAASNVASAGSDGGSGFWTGLGSVFLSGDN